MISQRENALRILHGQKCEFVPDVKDVVVAMETPILQRPETEGGRDAYGVNWLADVVTGGCVYEVGQKRIIEDIEEWKGCVKFPDVAGADWEDYAKKVDHNQDRVYSVILTMGPLERMEALCNMEECMCNLVVYPEESAELAMAIAENHAEIIRYAAKYLKPDFFVVHDDWGTEFSLFIGKDTWKEIIQPAMKVIYAAVKEAGVPLIQHTCGKVEELLDEILEMGAAGWESCQVCNDLPAIIEKYQDRMVYMGTMDARRYMRDTLDEAEIRKYFADTIRMLGKYGRYFPETILDGPVGEQKMMEVWFKDELDKYNKEHYGV